MRGQEAAAVLNRQAPRAGSARRQAVAPATPEAT
jgi:hypothetical protein